MILDNWLALGAARQSSVLIIPPSTPQAGCFGSGRFTTGNVAGLMAALGRGGMQFICPSGCRASVDRPY